MLPTRIHWYTQFHVNRRMISVQVANAHAENIACIGWANRQNYSSPPMKSSSIVKSYSEKENFDLNTHVQLNNSYPMPR